MFHVETTAWEGDGAWKGGASTIGEAGRKKKEGEITAKNVTSSSIFAEYGSYFWSKQS